MFSYHKNLLLMMMQMQVLVLLMNLGNGQNECRNISCGSNSDDFEGEKAFNEVRFPFKLVDGKTNNNRCGYPGFALSCTHNNVTMLEFPANPALARVRLSVNSIDYESRQLHASDPHGCLPRLFLQLHNSSIYPFQFDSSFTFNQYAKTSTNVTFFNCSSVGSRYLTNRHSELSSPQDMFACPIYAADSEESVVELGLVSCTKMLELVSPVLAEELRENGITLKWSKPKCDVHNFYCNHKPSNLPTIILPPTGDTI